MTTVNGEALDPELLREAFQRIKSAEEARTEASCCERDPEFYRQAEEELIEGVLLSQEAERRIPEPSKDDVRTAMEATLREWREHGASWDLLEQRRNEIRSDLTARLRMDRFTESVWDNLPELTEADHRAWFEAHAEDFRTTARAHVLHLVRFPGPRPDEDHRQLRQLREAVLDGASFTDIAREHTAKEDGQIDLGWIDYERPLNPFEAMLFSLREKEVSPVFFYEQALHLVWIQQLEPERIPPFEELAEEVAPLALKAQRRQALADIARELRKTATIVRNDEPNA
ncbi:peptidylprolyl isomerase [Haloferula rosea]|uniref:Peptidyl-prolyl cis-trans isomerase n=1 Tax=Haloferula rosea TaxID=490093 RepID=A0A934VEX3_9BACT|nr:peptidylprolyl isomerase [Haloferula rosea]MBK1827764.1 peptidyl-prolyl cis-trans isomerase [Haloferula rosea]